MSEGNKSYKQIIKSTGIFGGSQIIIILIGVFRNKILAILLGSLGIGIMSMYQTIQEMVKSLSSFGIENTGVREISSIKGTENKTHLAETIYLVDRLSFVFASIGAIACILLSYPISIWAFDDTSFTLNICLLSICVFFSILSAGQTVILHGLRIISIMVRSTLLWSSLGLILSLPLYYFLRLDGIIPAFIVMSVAMYIISLYYRNKADVKVISIPLSEVFKRGFSIFRIGFFIVVSSIITSIGYFYLRTLLVEQSGLYLVGLFQAAWSITSVYLMLVLKSMGADFYPRLCSIVSNNSKTRKLINEQTYIVLIVSTPLIILLLLFSRFTLTLLYSSEFSEATNVLNWQVLGTFFKVLSWPLAFILLAKGKGLLYFISEMIFMLTYLLFIHYSFISLNFESVGIAYLIAYALYLVIVYCLGLNLCGFRWATENLKIMFTSSIMILLAFCLTQYYRSFIIPAGIPILLVSILYSFFKLNKVFSVKQLFSRFK